MELLQGLCYKLKIDERFSVNRKTDDPTCKTFLASDFNLGPWHDCKLPVLLHYKNNSVLKKKPVVIKFLGL